MKALTALCAALVAALPLHAQETPGYAKVMAYEICRQIEAGMSERSASNLVIHKFWPLFGGDIKRDGYEQSARYLVAEQMIQCGPAK